MKEGLWTIIDRMSYIHKKYLKECLAFSQLNLYFLAHNLLIDGQYGFGKRHSKELTAYSQ